MGVPSAATAKMTTEVETVATIKAEIKKGVKAIDGRPDYLTLHKQRRQFSKALKKYKHPHHPKTGHSGLTLTKDQQQLLLGHNYIRVTAVQEKCQAPANGYTIYNSGQATLDIQNHQIDLRNYQRQQNIETATIEVLEENIEKQYHFGSKTGSGFGDQLVTEVLEIP